MRGIRPSCSSSSARPRAAWGPVVAYAGGPEALRADAEAAGVDLYVHAPYVVNVATTNNRIRILSRGPPAAHGRRRRDRRQGADRPRRPCRPRRRPGCRFRQLAQGDRGDDLKIPLLLENTAGGDNAMASPPRPDRCVWDAIASAAGADQVGFASIPRMPGRRDRTRHGGRQDPRHHRPHRPRPRQRQPRRISDSGADRHANFGAGHIDQSGFVDLVRAAGAPVICETRGGAEEHGGLRTAASEAPLIPMASN